MRGGQSSEQAGARRNAAGILKQAARVWNVGVVCLIYIAGKSLLRAAMTQLSNGAQAWQCNGTLHDCPNRGTNLPPASSTASHTSTIAANRY